MNSMLNAVVSYGPTPERSVNRQLLNIYTKKVTNITKYSIRWKEVKQLYIFGTASIRSTIMASETLASGAYVGTGSSEWVLITGAEKEDIQKYLSFCEGKLECLIVRFTDVAELNVEKLTGLTELSLTEDPSFEGLQGLDRLTKLKTLTLTGTGIRTVGLSKTLPNLQVLSMEETPLEDAQFLAGCPKLQRAELSGTKIRSIPSLGELKELYKLDLSASSLDTLEGVEFPEGLRTLNLRKTPIQRLPDSIGRLRKLESVDLSELKLEELPEWLPDLGLEFSTAHAGSCIFLGETEIKGIDMSIFDRRLETIAEWIRRKKQDRLDAEAPTPLNELKVVFLGDGEAGKSHTIARLLNNGGKPLPEHFDDKATPGIMIRNKTYKIGDRSVAVHFWDFGGQEILHSMHRVFLTKRTLYVVVLNVREGNQDERARYWLHNLKSFAEGAPVLLVMNKMDMNKNASLNERDLRSMYPGLTEIVRMSALTDSEETVQQNLIAALVRQIGEFDTLESPFLSSWRNLKEQLQGMNDPYIRGARFKNFCDDCGVDANDDTRADLLEWFNDLGVSFFYRGSKNLEDYVVLRPDWITNAIYTILFNKMEQVKNGVVPLLEIHQMLQNAGGSDAAIRSTVPGARYNEDDVEYVMNVIRKFRLSFQMPVGDDEEKKEFMPMLCGSNATELAAEYFDDPEVLEFQMHYDYLPNNVIHRLMVDRSKELDLENVWLTGALFNHGDTGLSAVVKSDGNMLRILVRSQRDDYPSQRYLDVLKTNLERINEVMGLDVEKMEVVYKVGDAKECFDYEDLLLAQELGDTHVRSKRQKKRIPLADILRQSDHPVDMQRKALIHDVNLAAMLVQPDLPPEEKKRIMDEDPDLAALRGQGEQPEDPERQKLIEDISKSCAMLADTKAYWDLTEDDRTDFIQKLLAAKGYIVMDQHRTGISAGEKQAGELDLEIRLETDAHWTAFEALNLRGCGDTQVTYWNDHLKKLLDNYNAAGRSFLFHVSYVQCKKEKFQELYRFYRKHLSQYSPPNFELQSEFVRDLPLAKTPSRQSLFMQAVECVYDCGGAPMTVYHYFVRIGA